MDTKAFGYTGVAEELNVEPEDVLRVGASGVDVFIEEILDKTILGASAGECASAIVLFGVWGLCDFSGIFLWELAEREIAIYFRKDSAMF